MGVGVDDELFWDRRFAFAPQPLLLLLPPSGEMITGGAGWNCC